MVDLEMPQPPVDRSTVPPLTEQTRREAREIIARYPEGRAPRCCRCCTCASRCRATSAPDAIALCAEELGLTKAEVGAVATFYTMYRRRPAGEYHVGVCTNTLCAVLGGDEILEAVSEHLGIGHDETTSDGRISLEHIECNAACDYAPVVMVNWEFHDDQTPQSAIAARRPAARGRARGADPRPVDAVHVQADVPRARRLPRRARHARACRPVRRPSPASSSPPSAATPPPLPGRAPSENQEMA